MFTSLNVSLLIVTYRMFGNGLVTLGEQSDYIIDLCLFPQRS